MSNDLSSKLGTTEIEFDEVYNNGWSTIARKGRFIYMETPQSVEAQAMARDYFRELKRTLPAKIEQAVQELETLLVQYNPFDLIANISLANLITDIDNYKEYKFEGNPAYTEYITLLYLTKLYGTYPENSNSPISGQVIETIQSKIQNLFKDQMLYFTTNDIDFDSDIRRSTSLELRARTLNESLIVRYTSYRHHLIDLLSDLFLPIDTDLVQILGFSFKDALALIDTIVTLIESKLHIKREKAIELEKQLQKSLKIFRKKRRVVNNFSKELLENLIQLKPSESAKLIRNMSISWLFHNAGELISFSVSELATMSGIEVSRVQSYLNSFSLRFGEVDAGYYRLPSPTHPLSTHPIIEQSASYYCPVPAQLYHSFREAIEVLLNSASKNASNTKTSLWMRYERNRAKYLELKALEYFQNALKHVRSYNNLKYTFNEDGQPKNGQLDGLIIFDSAIFFIEAKAGALSPSARRGAPKRMVDDLKLLVEEAYSQALRAKNYFNAFDVPVFYQDDGSEVTISKQEIDRIYLVTITLDNLDAFIANLYELNTFDFFRENEYPWVVSLTDLRVITELIEFPSQLVDYLYRRIRLNKQGFASAHDELDLFGHYLHEGLYFDDPGEDEPIARLRLLSYTTLIDQYYFFVMGDRAKPAQKPVQPMPELMRKLLEELEDIHPTGYLRVTSTLLGMSSTERDKFAHNYENLRKQTILDKEFHDFTSIYGRLGITCMFTTSENFTKLKKRLGGYCNMKKYQTKRDVWIGIGCVADSSGYVHGLHIVDTPWQYDEILEKIVEENLIPLDSHQRANLSI